MHHVCNFLSASGVVLIEGKVGFEFDCCLPDEIGDVLCAKVHRPVETGDDGPHSHACWTAVLVYTCHDHISMIIFLLLHSQDRANPQLVLSSNAHLRSSF